MGVKIKMGESSEKMDEALETIGSSNILMVGDIPSDRDAIGLFCDLSNRASRVGFGNISFRYDSVSSCMTLYRRGA